MMADDLDGVPNGWACTTLENVAAWSSGGTPSRSVAAYFQGTIPWIKTGELGDKYVRNAEEYISEQAIAASSAKIFPKGAVGIAMYGATIGKVSIWGIDASTNQACAVGIPFSGVLDNEFLYYFLLSQKRSFIKAGKGGAQPNISQGIIKEWPIGLPPLNEQHRIVAKIEELFSELDKGIEALKTAREQLKVYRQALLKHAFEGKLTAAWRLSAVQDTAQAGAANPDKLEPAAALLARIQLDREQRYQQQLQQWQTHGGNKPKAPKPLPPLSAEELAELPELPEGWGWVRIGELVDRVTVGHVGSMKDEYVENGIPFLRSQNVRMNRFDAEGLKFISEAFHDSLKKSELCAGDVVVVRSGSIGVSCVVPESLGVANCSDLVIVKGPRHILSSLLAYYMNWQTQGRVKGKMVGVALVHFNTKSVEEFAIPIMPVNEQEELLSYIESRLSEADQLDQTLTTSLQQSEALRQSILKRAFAGTLVAQDPHDLPASELLERIRAEKVKPAPNAKSTRSKRNE